MTSRLKCCAPRGKRQRGGANPVVRRCHRCGNPLLPLVTSDICYECHQATTRQGGGSKRQRGKGLPSLASAKAKEMSHPENARPGFPGEKHARLRTTAGLKKANFMGPGTQNVKRIQRGDQPVSYMDGVAGIHDADYTLAENKDDVRKADLRMIARAKRAQKEGLDYPLNMALGRGGIAAKVVLEKVGLPRSAFASMEGKKLDPATRALVTKQRATLVQQGYGAKKKKKKKSVLTQKERKKFRVWGKSYRQ